jgi:hypothetical protein
MRRNIPEPLALFFSGFLALTLYELPQLGLVAGVPFFLILWSALPRRGSTFEATLPIRGRDILAARVLGHLALMSLPLVAWMYASIVTHGFPVIRVFDATLIVMLALILPYAIRPGDLYEIPFLIIAAVWLALAAVSAAVIYVLPPDVALEALLIAVVVAGRSIWMRIPDSLEMESRKAAVVKPRALVTRRSTTRPVTTSRAWKPLLLSMFQGGKNRSGDRTFVILVIYVAMFMFGLASRDRFQPFMLYYVVVPLGMARQGTRWLTAFPISNRARLWCVLVPGVVLALGCVELGRIAAPLFIRNRTSMATNAPGDSHDRNNITRVPLEFWRRATADRVIAAPWGETAVADTLSVLHVSLQNPYTTNVGNSTRFVEWQFQRATTAVYGRPMTIALYQRRNAEGTLPPDVLSSRRMKILNGATIFAVVLLVALLGELALWYRIGTSRAGSWIVQLSFVVVFLAAIAIDFIYAKYPMSSVVVSIVESSLLHLSGVLPGSLVAMTIISALPVIAIYALLEWQFGRAESVEARRPVTRVGRFLARPVPYVHTS